MIYLSEQYHNDHNTTNMDNTKYKVLLSILVLDIVNGFVLDVPQVPTGSRSQYYVLNENGAYKYGYDTGDELFAKQSGDPSNQVEGEYGYKDHTSGHHIDLKYSSGVQGYSPYSVNHLGGPILQTPHIYTYHVPVVTVHQPIPSLPHQFHPHPQQDPYHPSNEITPQFYQSPDGSYSFSYSAPDQGRRETADSENNVQGDYYYINKAGKHDLSYVAGSSTGFQPIGGSLSVPNGLTVNSTGGITEARIGGQQNDASYNFAINTDDYQRQESADPKGNVQGRNSYKNEAGEHDLSYVAGRETGFVATGGNLAAVRGPKVLEEENRTDEPSYSTLAPGDETTEEETPGDASYKFSFDTDEYKREESSDASGNVQGSYSYKNKDGTTYDLTYKAGSKTGFLTTGGNLGFLSPPVPSPAYSIAPDGSYQFSIDTPEYQRQEFVDPTGNVKGYYSYKNQVGQHDLSYEAGAAKGFLPTGGSLLNAPGVQFGVVSQNFRHESTKLVDGVLVKAVIPPEEAKNYGYVFESTK